MAYTHFRLFLIKRRAAPEHIIAHYHAGGTIGTNQTLSFELLPELPRFSAEDYPVADGSTANLPLSYTLSDHIRQVIEDSGIGLEFAPIGRCAVSGDVGDREHLSKRGC